MKRDWRKERWRRQHIREPLQERLWSVVARGLREYLRMLAEDDGTLIGRADDPITALLKVLNPEAAELELVRAAIATLLRDGFLQIERDSLWISSFAESQASETREPEDVHRSTAASALAGSRPAQTSTKRVQDFRKRQRERNADGVSAGVSRRVSAAVETVSVPVPVSVSFSRDDDQVDPSQQRDIQKYTQTDLPLHAHGSAQNVSPSVSCVPRRDDDGNGSGWSESRIQQTLALPVQSRATLVLDHPGLARVLKPHQWPEVLAVAAALANAEGQSEPLLSNYERDAGVRNLVALFATGVTVAELKVVASTVPKQAWWTASGKRLGLESLTINGVRRNRPKALVRARDPSPRVAAVLAQITREREVG
jgi:hypothetical protein